MGIANFFIENHLSLPCGHFMVWMFFEIFFSTFKNSLHKKFCEIWKVVEKNFLRQKPKWWVMRSLGSFITKFLNETQAEKMHLKIFLKASFRKAKASSKTQKSNCGRLVQDYEKWDMYPEAESKVWLHNVPLDFLCDQRFTSDDQKCVTFCSHCKIFVIFKGHEYWTISPVP